MKPVSFKLKTNKVHNIPWQSLTPQSPRKFRKFKASRPSLQRDSVKLLKMRVQMMLRSHLTLLALTQSLRWMLGTRSFSGAPVKHLRSGLINGAPSRRAPGTSGPRNQTRMSCGTQRRKSFQQLKSLHQLSPTRQARVEDHKWYSPKRRFGPQPSSFSRHLAHPSIQEQMKKGKMINQTLYSRNLE